MPTGAALVALTSTITAIVVSLFCLVALPRMQRTREPACHDTIYVWPLSDDEMIHDDLPAKRLTFSCPHSEQRLDFLGHGGFTCKCDSYRK